MSLYTRSISTMIETYVEKRKWLASQKRKKRAEKERKPMLISMCKEKKMREKERQIRESTQKRCPYLMC